jgi:hypothetical protein
MLDQSSATIRRLIDRGHLSRASGIAAVRIPHGSIQALLSTGASEPINLVKELKRHGPCLVLAPDVIARLYRIHLQTAYRMLARGSLRTISWLWCRRILRSEISRALYGPLHHGEAARLLAPELHGEKSSDGRGDNANQPDLFHRDR